MPRLLLFAGIFLSGALSQAIGSIPGRVLTPEQRVEAQRAIEQVYWRHRTWPADNTMPRPSFDEAVPEHVIRGKVDKYLRESEALRVIWGRPITAEQLQAEMTRIASSTRSPEVLRELISALRDDPVLVAECLVRPILVDRLTRSWYAWDGRFHARERRKAEEALSRSSLVDQMPELGDTYVEMEFVRAAPSDQEQPAEPNATIGAPVRLQPAEWDEMIARLGTGFDTGWQPVAAGAAREPVSYRTLQPGLPTMQVGRLLQEEERFYVEAILREDENGLRVATVSWPKRPFDSWWPEVRSSLAGELSIPDHDYVLPETSGDSCQPDTWRPMRGRSPSPRTTPGAVWTGSEMIIWGGNWSGGAVNTGGRYDPATDSWSPTKIDANTPAARTLPGVVWTGTEMIVWGGEAPDLNCCTRTFPKQGGRYDPVTDTWTPMSTAGPIQRSGHSSVWTGTEMIIWGGWMGGNYYWNDGARYNPTTDRWTWVAWNYSVPSPRSVHTAVWTGSEMIVWGGYSAASGAVKTGGRYDPSTNTWRPVKADGTAPAARNWHAAVWTGSEMLVWGGHTSTGYPEVGGRYDPLTDSWTPMSTGPNAPPGRTYLVAAWSGEEMIVWGGARGSTELDSGGRYDPATDTWRATRLDASTPFGSRLAAAVWTGVEMLIWGGYNASSYYVGTGGRYDPRADSWAPLVGSNLSPEDGVSEVVLWTGAEMLVWGGEDKRSGGRYVPATDTWTPTSLDDAPAGGLACSGVWTGSEMIVWGGALYYGHLPVNTGGRYDPAADSWRPTAVDAETPAPGFHRSVVWTGREMIVWGGYDGYTLTNKGGRYDPVADRWFRVEDGATAPKARCCHAAVWTGSEMIIWGGQGAPELNRGGRYDPMTDSWRPTIVDGSTPVSRVYPSVVWTGHEMIVWGGVDGATTASGGRYRPETDTWLPTREDPSTPVARALHSAVWTGADMIVWGGRDRWNNPTLLRTGGRYRPSDDTWAPTSVTPSTPSARNQHKAVWTGTEMIVWGGGDPQITATGGRYCGCTGPQAVYHRDADGDGYGDPALDRLSCVGAPATYVSDAGDCDDLDPSVHPGVTESCDGRDEDCSGAADEGFRLGESCSVGVGTCLREGTVICAEDQRDSVCGAAPGDPVAEICDGLDNDCDGSLPDEEADSDDDGFRGCQHDCNDTDPAIGPQAVELPGNAVDEDCDDVVTCSSSAFYKTHGMFIRCVAHECERLVAAALVSRAECDALVSQAAKSDVGRRQRVRARPAPVEP